MKRVVVVGAGISGLAIAHALRKRGHDPLVVERDERAGGKVRSVRSPDGFLTEYGPASFLAREPALLELVRDLGLEDRMVPARPTAKKRCVAFEGALHAVPSGPGSLLGSPLLPAGAKLRLLGDLFLPRGPAGRGEDESIASFASRRLGSRAAERLFHPLVSGIFAGDAESLSLPSAFPLLATLEREHRSVILGAAKTMKGGAGLFTFQDGLEELTRALARELGPRLRTGVSLQRIEERPEGGLVVHVQDHGRAETIEADDVIVAVPAHAAAPALASLDADAAGALAAIPYAPVTLVDLGWRVGALPRPLDGYGFLVARDEASSLMGCVFSSSAFPGRADEEKVLVSARIGGARRPELARASDDVLVAVVRDELRRYLGVTDAPEFVRIVRHERAIPQYVLGHRERLAVLDAAEKRHPGLHFAGNAYRGLGVPDCVKNAFAVADRVAGRA